MSASPEPDPHPPAFERPQGLRGFLRGPHLVDRRGFGFLVAIFVLVAFVFGVAFYAFLTTLQTPAPAPIQFSTAAMVGGNGTFNVTADSGGSWAWQNFTVNLTINNFGGMSVPLAPSGVNATLVIGSTTHKDPYHVVWIDRDHDGKVSVGDTFLVTGNGVPLPSLSYCKFSLAWSGGAWTATEYWVTSDTIV